MKYNSDVPGAQLFADFRQACGWGRVDLAIAKTAIANSLYFECAYENSALIGFGRVIGDGALNYYIQDLIVADHARGQSIGTALMTRLLASIRKDAMQGATIGLMAAFEKDDFYKQFGFAKRPNNELGAGMTLVI